jgi:hypothetical protein
MPLANSSSDSHWKRVTRSFLIDAALLPMSFKIAATLRFEDLISDQGLGFLPAILNGALALPSLLYISGFYVSTKLRPDRSKEALQILEVLAATTLIVIAMGSLVYSARVGRGVMGLGITSALVLIRHLAGSRHFRYQKTAFVVSNRRDEQLAQTFNKTLDRRNGLMVVFTTA